MIFQQLEPGRDANGSAHCTTTRTYRRVSCKRSERKNLKKKSVKRIITAYKLKASRLAALLQYDFIDCGIRIYSIHTCAVFTTPPRRH